MKITCFKKQRELSSNDVVTHLQPYRAIKRRFNKDHDTAELKLYYNNADEFVRFELLKGSLNKRSFNKLNQELSEVITDTLEYYKEIEKRKSNLL